MALRAALETEPEPLVAITHLLRLCRDEHRVLWEQVSEPSTQAQVARVLAPLTMALPSATTGSTATRVIDAPIRHAMATALASVDGATAVVLAHALAQFLDDRYGHTFTDSFRRRSPYQPGAGDPVPLETADLRSVLDMRPTSPPWTLANRLDETRRIRLAGEWAVGFQIVFDYSLLDALAGVITADTIIATCHPNRSLNEFLLPLDPAQPAFPIHPIDMDRQREEIHRLVAAAATGGASIVVLPELCVTEELAFELADWVRRPDGLQLLVAGSYHHVDDHGQGGPSHRRRNTAIGWVRGHDRPLHHNKHSPADRPVIEDIQPEGWPELRVYVTADGWHLVIAICRDLLNPQAVHALTEAGANLVLVPAMSETLMAFGGPAAQLVGSNQSLVAVANNPALWSDEHDPTARRPARALFGHPGLGQLTRLVHGQDAETGIALLQVRSGQIRWHTNPAAPLPDSGHRAAPSGSSPTPAWAAGLSHELQGCVENDAVDPSTNFRAAAVLVLLTDRPDGRHVLLTRRTPDLGDFPDQWVFPGGVADPSDHDAVATALREATEETGLDRSTVHVIGTLPTFALPAGRFLVAPVLAWSARPEFTGIANPAEVAAVAEIALRELADRPSLSTAQTPARDNLTDDVIPQAWQPDRPELGRMTAALVDLVVAMLARADRRHDAAKKPASPATTHPR